MKVRDFIKQDIDVDVYDDVCEECAIAFVGPLELTDAGMERFAAALDLEVTVDGNTATVHVDDDDDEEMERRLAHATEFFSMAAGYCSEAIYQMWFKERQETKYDE